MTGLSDYLLSVLISNGSPLFGIFLLLGALGFPFPTTLLVIASGAFIRQGMLSPEAVLVGLFGAVLGDSLSFGLGRLGQGWLLARFGASAVWQRANQSFINRGGAAIYLTRWLFTSIAIPTNWVAGSSGYRFDRFLLYDLVGEATWIVLFGSLGYWLGSQWELASQYLSEFSVPLLGLAVAVVGSYLGIRKLWDSVRARTAVKLNNSPIGS